MKRCSWLVALLCCAATHPSLAQSLCASRLPALPQPISNNAVTSVDHGDGTYSLLSFMGLTGPGWRDITPSSYRLDLPGGTWTQIANAPRLNNRAKIAANAVTVGGEVYLVGGYTVRSSLEITEHRLFRYDLVSDTYEQLADVPVQVDDTVTGVIQDRYILLASGWHGPINNNTLAVQIYDTQTDTWQSATSLPGPATGLFGHGGTIIGDQFVVFDGVRTDGGFSLSDAMLVGQIDPLGTGDLTNIAWTTTAAHPGEATYRAAVSQGAALDDQLLLLGGTSNPYNYSGTGYNGRPAVPLDQALLYDTLTSDWNPITVEGQALPTMDHRGLVATPSGWATIGGMVDTGVVTDQVVLYEFHDNGTLCAVPEPGGFGLMWAACLVGLALIWRRPGCA